MDEKQMDETRTLLREFRAITLAGTKGLNVTIKLIQEDDKKLRKLYSDSIGRRQTAIKKKLKTLGFTGDVSDGS